MWHPLQRLKDLILPFAEIAKELRIIRELKELELGARVIDRNCIPAPLYRVTEAPKSSDTEVSFPGDKEKSKFAKLLDVDEEDD